MARTFSTRCAWLAIAAVLGMGPMIAAASSLSPAQTQEVATIEQSTVQIRGLSPLQPVKVAVESDARFNAVVLNQVKALSPDSEIETSQRESVLLGLLKRSENLRHILFSNVTGNVIGLYDPASKTLYVRNHDNLVFGIQRHVLAHEYNHALQDQHYDLKKLLPDETPLSYRNTDSVGAHHALTEGDSINVETMYILKTYSGQELNALQKYESQSTSPPLPKSIKEQLLFAYTTGYSFVSALYRHGGMGAVNAAFARLPSSTYEIMHPSAYLKGWKPTNVVLHAVVGFPTWKQVDDDVFGALGYDILLKQFLSARRASTVIDAYRGDRYVFLENGAQNAVLMKSIWTDGNSARAAQGALLDALGVRFRHIRIVAGAPTIARDKYVAVAFSLHGAELTMAYGPTSLIARGLVSGATT